MLTPDQFHIHFNANNIASFLRENLNSYLGLDENITSGGTVMVQFLYPMLLIIHAPACVARSGSVKVMVVMFNYNMLLLFRSSPAQHKPIGMAQLVKYQMSKIKFGVHFAPVTAPIVLAPFEHGIAFLHGNSTKIYHPFIIELA